MADRPQPTWKQVLTTLVAGQDLTADEARWALGEILGDAATSAQIAGFALALRVKGETPEELAALLDETYAHSVPIEVKGRTVDVVGTGGDGAHTVNISSMAAIVAAGAGAKVVKHGNRSASSLCGAADLLEALGVPLDLEPERVAALADEVGITFCFAPYFHPAFRHAGPTRRELGVPTVFNILGPLANPARARAQALGVADARMAGIVAHVLAGRGVEAMVFRGDDGLDELTTVTTSQVWVVHDGSVVEERLDPADLGLPTPPADALRGGDVAFNTDVARRVFAGETGPVRDAVLLNAAAAIAVYDPIEAPLVDRLRTALSRAEQAIDGGGAAAVVDHWVTTAGGTSR